MKNTGLKLIFLLLWTACTGWRMAASPYDTLHNHIIVSIDEAGCRSWNASQEVAAELKNILFSTQYTADSRPLFSSGDYFSMTGFAISAARQNGMQMYVSPLHDRYSKNESMIYSRPSETELSDFFDIKYRDYANNFYDGYELFSLVSIAKPYTLRALKNDTVSVNRTYIVQVTDHHYNGCDFYDELQSLQWRQLENYVTPENMHELLRNCYDVEQNYFIRWIETRQLGYKRYIELYEAVPLQRNFTLPAAVEYPESVVAKRLPGGKYEIKIPVSMRQNVNYSVEKIVFSLENKAIVWEGNDTMLTFMLPASSKAEYIDVRAWLRLRDGFYDATVMSPLDDAPDELGREGLNRRIRIEREPDAKIFFFDMPGWLWIPGIKDQNVAAGILMVIIVIILICLVGWWLLKPIYFHPEVSDFKITRKKTEQ